MDNLPPLWMLKYLPNMLACHVTIIHGAEGPSNTITCAESSGLLCLGEASRVIERGDADLCFAGGCESKINPLGIARMTLGGRIAPTGEQPDGARFAKPYDPSSGGGLPGEGGAILMVESAEHARARGADRIYARIAGFGAGHSAVPVVPSEHKPGPTEPDFGVLRAVRAALDDAGIGPGEVDAIVPGALGIPETDAAEAAALAEVFGERLSEIETLTLAPLVGVSAAGHGALLAAAGALAVRHQQLPARIHAGTPRQMLAEACASRPRSLHNVLVCSPALGGQVGALVLRPAGDAA